MNICFVFVFLLEEFLVPLGPGQCSYAFFALITTDGTTRATFRIPRQTVQKAVDDCIKKKKWRQLYALFLGGGGEKMFQQHVGGLASGCDASTVKLEQITEESNVPRLDKFISTLMEHQGPPVCDGHAARKQPVDVAKERKDVRVTERPSPKPGRAEETQVYFPVSYFLLFTFPLYCLCFPFI